MRVFVVGTGRCGTVSFREACRYIENYTSGHETISHELEYPDQYIEVNPHFHARLHTLIYKYPDALWVHLIRRYDVCVESLAAMDDGQVMLSLGRMYPSIYPAHDALEIASLFYHDINLRINRSLCSMVSPDRRMAIHLETVKHQWKTFWDWIHAEGDYQASLASWDTPHNIRRIAQ